MKLKEYLSKNFVNNTMSYKFQGKQPPVILTCTLHKILDTKMGHMEVADFEKMMNREDKSPLTQ